MDFLEKKNINVLQRLRQLQVEQCCSHIDKQITIWYSKERPSKVAKQNRPTPVVATPTVAPTVPEALAAITTSTTSNTSTTLTTTTTTTTTPATTETVPHEVPALTTIVESDLVPTINTGITTSPRPVEDTSVVPDIDITNTSNTTAPTLIAAPTTSTTADSADVPFFTAVEEDDPTVAVATTIATAPDAPKPTSLTSSPSKTESTDSNSNPPILTPIATPRASPQASAQKIVGCFLSNIKHLESFDSDATESNSSVDSYDELEGFSHEDIPPKRSTQPLSCSQRYRSSSAINHLPSPHNQIVNDSYYNTGHQNSHYQQQEYDVNNLKKKAIWKWAHERSRLASRWTWLQAQVADLEFRIRGQNDATMHARAYKTQPLPPVLPENSCSRTVPLSRDFRRRRLVKSSQILSDSNKKLVKFSHVPCICASLPQTVAPCLPCNGRYNYLRQIDGDNLPVTERISLLDPCCHPVLSFPDDLTLGSQLSYLLKQETINRKPTKGRPGRKKGSTAANLAAAAAAAAAAALANGENNSKHAGKKGKYYHRMVGRPPGSQSLKKNQSHSMITSNKLRRKYRKHNSTGNNYDSNNWNGSSNHAHPTRRNKRIRRASSINESSVCSESSNHYRPNHFSSNNPAQSVTRRRRSEQSAYDIDNIVIPFSIAATTRVEILEYKEIMTPSWRVWENETCQNNTADEEEEDTSDEIYIQRHSKGESEEKKRFSLKPPKNTTINNSINNSTTTVSTITEVDSIEKEVV